MEISAPPRLRALLPGTPVLRRATADLRVDLGSRLEPTTGGRYGLSASEHGQYTFTSPATVARIDFAGRTCRAEVVATREDEGLPALLRVLSILLVTESGGGLALHASAALRGGKAYLFSGPGGAGKSTALRRALEVGAEPLADDLVLLRRERGRRRNARCWARPIAPTARRWPRCWSPNAAGRSSQSSRSARRAGRRSRRSSRRAHRSTR
jgi:hypothetical protein